MFLKNYNDLNYCTNYHVFVFYFFYMFKFRCNYNPNYNLVFKKKYCEKYMEKFQEEENLSQHPTFIFKKKNIDLIFRFINFRKRKKLTFENKNFVNKKFFFYIKIFFYYPSLIKFIYFKKKRKFRLINLENKKFVLFTLSISSVNMRLLEEKFLIKTICLKKFLIFKIENFIEKKSYQCINLKDIFKKITDSKFCKLTSNNSFYPPFLIFKKFYPKKFFLWKTRFFGLNNIIPCNYFFMKKNNYLIKNINIFCKKLLFENKNDKIFYWKFGYFLNDFLGGKLQREIYLEYRIKKNFVFLFLLYKICNFCLKKSIAKFFELQFEIIRIFTLKYKIIKKKLINLISNYIFPIKNFKISGLLRKKSFFFKDISFFFIIDIILYKTIKLKSISLGQKISKIINFFPFPTKKKKTIGENFFFLFNKNLSNVEFLKIFCKNNFNHIELETYIFFSNQISNFRSLPKRFKKKLCLSEEKFIFKILYWIEYGVFNDKLNKFNSRINSKKSCGFVFISQNFAKFGLENFSRNYLSKIQLLTLENTFFFSFLYGKMIFKSGFIGKSRFNFFNGFLIEKLKNEKETKKIFGFWFFIEYINGSISIIEKILKLNFFSQNITKTYFKKYFYI